MAGSTASGWFRDWEINSAVIEVRITENLMTEAREIWTADLAFDPDEQRLDFDTAGELFEAVMGDGEHTFTPNFTADFRRSYTSWGADGAAETLVIQVAAAALGIGEHAVVGNATYDALKAALVSLAARWQERSGEHREPLGREEAVQRARWHVIHRFELDIDEESFDRPSLVLAGEEEHADGSRLVRLRDGDRLYEVELLDDAGLVVIGRIGWSED